MSADPQINLSLPLSAVNLTLGVLGQRPYAEVAGLIQTIVAQANEQVAKPPLPPLPPIDDRKDDAAGNPG